MHTARLKIMSRDLLITPAGAWKRGKWFVAWDLYKESFWKYDCLPSVSWLADGQPNTLEALHLYDLADMTILLSYLMDTQALQKVNGTPRIWSQKLSAYAWGCNFIISTCLPRKETIW